MSCELKQKSNKPFKKTIVFVFIINNIYIFVIIYNENMNFEYKDIKIDNKKFKIKYLLSVEDYQLEISNNKISIGVFYLPNLPISMREAELVIEKHSFELKKNVDLIIYENLEFYKTFKPETNFTQFGTSAGLDIYGEIIAEYSNAVLFLNKK